MRRRRRRFTSGLNKRATGINGRGGSGAANALQAVGRFLLRVVMLPVTFVQWLAALISGKTKKNGGALAQDGAALASAAHAPKQNGIVSESRSVALTVIDIALIVCMLASVLFAGHSAHTADTSVPVTLTVDGTTRTIYTKTQTVSELLALQNVTLGSGDSLNVSTSAPITENMQLTVRRAFPVAVASAGKVSILYMLDGTVAQALQDVGVTYDANDRLSQISYADVTPGMSIQHTSVETRYETVEKPIEYNEEIIKDKDRYEDYAQITTEGEDGLRRVVRQLVYEEGELISREIMDSIVLKEAVNEVKVVGTKIRYQTSFEGEWRRAKDKPSAGKNGWVAMTVYRVTAYCTGSRTATGTRPKLGTIAVNPKIIPYGTEIWIKGYGYGTAQDTGAFRNYPEPRNNAIDVWLNTKSEAMRWGSKYNMTILVKMG